MIEVLSEAGGALLAAAIIKFSPSTARILQHRLADSVAVARCPITTFWSDFKRAIDNPFGLLWMLTGFSILGIAVWASLAPATAPVTLWLPLVTLLCLYLVYFTWSGLKPLWRDWKPTQR